MIFVVTGWSKTILFIAEFAILLEKMRDSFIKYGGK